MFRKRRQPKNSYRAGIKKRGNNPQIYSRTKTIIPEKNFSKFFFAVFIMLLLGFIYVLVFSPALKIKEVELNGDREAEKINEIVGIQINGSVLGKNLLFFNVGGFTEEIMKDQSIKEVELRKVFPNKLDIKITRREGKIIWEENSKTYIIDEDGVIFKELQGGEVGEFRDLPSVKNKLVSLSSIGDKVADESFIIFINFLINNFEKEITDKIVSIEITDSKSEITLFTDKKYKVYFDTKRSVARQLDSLKEVKKATKDSAKSLEYVDLRIETRIFYK